MKYDAATMLDRYLNELCWAMGGTLAEQQAVRDELVAHVADAAREHRMSGASDLDATRRALADLGEPRELGRTMRGTRAAAARSRPLVQPAGAIILAAHRERHLPHPALLAALAASGATAAIVAVAYAWPG
jgi:hypothetical protein